MTESRRCRNDDGRAFGSFAMGQRPDIGFNAMRCTIHHSGSPHARLSRLAAVAFMALGVGSLAGWAVGPACADEVRTLSHQGLERRYELHRPPQGAAARMPAVVALHGNGEPLDHLRQSMRLDPVADRDGFLVAYPEAVDLRWSYGRPIVKPMPDVSGEPVDDVGLLRKIFDDLVANAGADPARIYLTGSSRGGLMTFTAACVLSERIAAAAPLITGMTEYQREDCGSGRPVPLVVIAGTADLIQTYDGWIAKQGRLLSVPETLEFWRSRYGCKRQTRRLLANQDRQDLTWVRLVDWDDCRAGAALRFYRVENGGHQVPSFALGEYGPPDRFGRRSRDIETAEEIWAFFKTFTR